MSKVVRLPGIEEADAILQDMQIAKQGVVAWVRAGLRLADVKARLPHGEFMKWVQANCARVHNLSLNHLCRAKTVAEALTLHVEKENKRTFNLDELIFMLESPDGQLAKIVDGKSTRQLTLEAREPKVLDLDEIAAEAKAKEWCEDIWEKKPEWRDKYEPKVLAGDLTYVKAKTAMTGNKNEGEERPEIRYAELLEKNFCGAARHFCQFEKLSEQEQEKIVEAAIIMAEKCPPRIAAILREVLPRVEGGGE